MIESLNRGHKVFITIGFVIYDCSDGCNGHFNDGYNYVKQKYQLDLELSTLSDEELDKISRLCTDLSHPRPWIFVVRIFIDVFIGYRIIKIFMIKSIWINTENEAFWRYMYHNLSEAMAILSFSES